MFHDPIHERCPHCPETHPRDQIDRHVTTSHSDLPPCTATLKHDGQTFTCSFRVGHAGGETGSWHASAFTPPQGRLVWCDTADDAALYAVQPDRSTAAAVGETDRTEPSEQVAVLQKRLRLAHQARRAKEYQLDDIRRALCDIGFMDDDDPYSHADFANVIRQVGETLHASLVLEKPAGVREQRERPTHPDGTPYRYAEMVAEGWEHCDGCRMWSTATPERPHQCPETNVRGPLPSQPTQDGA